MKQEFLFDRLEEDIREFLHASGDSIIVGKTFLLDYYGIDVSFKISDPELKEAAKELSGRINSRLWSEPIYEDSLIRHEQPQYRSDRRIPPSYRKALAKRIRKVAKNVRRFGDAPSKKALSKYPGLYNMPKEALKVFLLGGTIPGVIIGAIAGAVGNVIAACFAASIIIGSADGLLLQRFSNEGLDHRFGHEATN